MSVSVEEWEDARQKSDQGNSTGIVDEDWARVDELSLRGDLYYVDWERVWVREEVNANVNMNMGV